jgi:hypothetical protein
METKNSFLAALDRAVNVITGNGPQNSATNAPLYLGAAGDEARAIVASTPGRADSPMDRTTFLKATDPGMVAGTRYPTTSEARAFDYYVVAQGHKRDEAIFLKLKEMDMPHLRLHEAIAQCARSQRPAYLAHLEDIATRVGAGDATAHREDGWSAEDWESDARERMSAFKAELRKLADRAWAIAEPALLEKAKILNAVADDLELEAQMRFEEFTVPFRPPAYVLLMRKYALTLSDGSRRNAGLPSSMIETL